MSVELSLDSAPPGLPEHEARKWVTDSYSPPNVNDVWIIAWDDIVELCCISTVRDGYVVAAPVTLGADQAVAGCRLVDAVHSPIGVPITVWSQAQTGLGLHLLARNLGPVEDLASGAVIEVPDRLTAEQEGFVEALLNRFQELCFHDWPVVSPGAGVIDNSVLEQNGVTARNFAKLIQEEHPGAAVEYWQGVRPLSAYQVARVEESLGIEWQSFLRPSEDAMVEQLRRPRFKSDLRNVARLRATSESESRQLVLDYANQAARSGVSDAESRVRAAIARIIREQADT